MTPTPAGHSSGEGELRVVARLTGSENHRGFNLVNAAGWAVGMVQPMDADGNGGRAIANRLALCWNTHDELVAELKSVLEWACVEKAPLRAQEISSIRAVLSKLEAS